MCEKVEKWPYLSQKLTDFQSETTVVKGLQEIFLSMVTHFNFLRAQCANWEHQGNATVLVKYAGHVRQRAQTLPYKMSGRIQCTENVQQERKEMLVIKMGDQNARQGIEGLPDLKLFSRGLMQ